jgi:thiosulfate/3-mercaptopyruvate sulfurtransferase
MAGYDRDDKRPRAKGAVKPEPKVFKVNLRPEMVVTMQDVQKALAAGTLLVDMRPEDQFVGINRHPKATESGTIPGARNLPNTWLFVNAGGQFRNKSQLEQLYKVANVPTTGEQIAFCNTGHWASIGWFVSSELLGNNNVKMYDGSMTEWTILKGGPVEQKVKLL